MQDRPKKMRDQYSQSAKITKNERWVAGGLKKFPRVCGYCVENAVTMLPGDKRIAIGRGTICRNEFGSVACAIQIEMGIASNAENAE